MCFLGYMSLSDPCQRGNLPLFGPYVSRVTRVGEMPARYSSVVGCALSA